MQNAKGVFEFNRWEESSFSENEGAPKLTQARVSNDFHGDIRGSSDLVYVMTYLTEETGSGSTIRLGRLKDSAHAAILFNCKTTLVDTFRERFPDQFEYRQTRALLLPVSGKLPKQDLSVCLLLALTYHLDRRRKR